jgi:hypothetical protein
MWVSNPGTRAARSPGVSARAARARQLLARRLRLASRAERGPDVGGPARLLQLDEDRVGLGGTDVLTSVFLRTDPTDGTGVDGNLDQPVAVGDPPVKRRQRHHYGVRAPMQVRAVARLVAVLEHSDAVVLEDTASDR